MIIFVPLTLGLIKSGRMKERNKLFCEVMTSVFSLLLLNGGGRKASFSKKLSSSYIFLVDLSKQFQILKL